MRLPVTTGLILFLRVLFIISILTVSRSLQALDRGDIQDERQTILEDNDEDDATDLIDELEDTEPQLYPELIDAVAELKGEHFPEVMQDLLARPQIQQDRKLAARVGDHLVKRDTPESAAVLGEALKSGQLDPADPIIDALGKHRVIDSAPTIKLQLEKGLYASSGMRALATMHSADLDQYVINAAKNRDHRSRVQAVQTLPLIQDTATATGTLVAIINSPEGDNQAVVEYALIAAGKMPFDESLHDSLEEYAQKNSNQRLTGIAISSMATLQGMGIGDYLKWDHELPLARSQAWTELWRDSLYLASLEQAAAKQDGDQAGANGNSQADGTGSAPSSQVALKEEKKSAQPSDDGKQAKESQSGAGAKGADSSAKSDTKPGPAAESASDEKATPASGKQSKSSARSSSKPAKKQSSSSPLDQGIKAVKKIFQPGSSNASARSKATGNGAKPRLVRISDRYTPAKSKLYRAHLTRVLTMSMGSERGYQVESRIHNAIVSYASFDDEFARYLRKLYMRGAGVDDSRAAELMLDGVNLPGSLGMIINGIIIDYPSRPMQIYVLQRIFLLKRWEAELLLETVPQERL